MTANTYRKGDRLLADLRNDSHRPIDDPGKDYTEAVVLALNEHDWFEVKLADGSPMTLHGTCLYERSLRGALDAWYAARADQRTLERTIAAARREGTAEANFIEARRAAAERVVKAQIPLRRGNPYWIGRP